MKLLKSRTRTNMCHLSLKRLKSKKIVIFIASFRYREVMSNLCCYDATNTNKAFRRVETLFVQVRTDQNKPQKKTNKTKQRDK